MNIIQVIQCLDAYIVSATAADTIPLVFAKFFREWLEKTTIPLEEENSSLHDIAHNLPQLAVDAWEEFRIVPMKWLFAIAMSIEKKPIVFLQISLNLVRQIVSIKLATLPVSVMLCA